MIKLNDKAVVFIPDGTKTEEAIARTTHMAISAHQDDIELMAYKPIADCFGQKDKWFCGVVTTDGAGSPRSGIYSNYTDEDMKNIRITEQKKAAYVGEYGSMLMLAHPSKQVKDPEDEEIINEYVEILKTAKPKYVYTHNLADKHDTHLGVVTKVIKAVRKLDKADRPEKLYGCEVWRDLDWVLDDKKVYMNTEEHPNISRCLVGVFDSQICGGKRYDLAADGRRTANATYAASHGCDTVTSMNYAMDLTPLIENDKLGITDYILSYIEDFKNEVKTKIDYLTKGSKK
jgi:LmbE family N-acetylglucosaminyl deacetylase